MFKSRKRSYRRHHLERMKNRSRRLYRQWYLEPLSQENPWQPEHNANHITSCSCTLCGNPRNHFRGKRSIELTHAEINAYLNFKEAVNDYDLSYTVRKTG